jgi:hypothetical protein
MDTNPLVDKQTERHGQQNTFYFEPSPLLTLYDKHSPMYTKLYESIPVVLLLGWTGARDQNMKKYQSIYTNQGYHVIRFAPSDKLTFLNRRLHPKYAYSLLDMMKSELKLVKNPIVTQAFSNASCFIVYQHIIMEINREGGSREYNFFKLNHRAAIYDSSPGWGRLVDLWSGVADLTKTIANPAPIRYFLSTLFLCMGLMYHYAHLGRHYFTNMFEVIGSDPRPVPSLYIYSKSDLLIYHENIARFMARRRALLPDLYQKSVVYETGDHVMLYMKYPEEYVRHVSDHLRLCKLDMRSILSQVDAGLDADSLVKRTVAKTVSKL